jgi:hypothetical protein
LKAEKVCRLEPLNCSLSLHYIGLNHSIAASLFIT